MKKIFTQTIVCFLLALGGVKSFGHHLAGADMSYTCLGTNQFEFTLVVYTECSSSKNDLFFNIKYFSESLGDNPNTLEPKSFEVRQIAREEIPLYCPGIVSNCTFGGKYRGLQKTTYKGIIVLPRPASDWTFVFNQSSRSFGATNVNTSFDINYVTIAKINTLAAACNNSPKFIDKAIQNSYVGQVTEADFGGIDVDGDILKYKFVSPKAELNTNITYKNGYSETNFLTTKDSPTIDNQGIVRFEATKLNEIGLTDVLIEEYRNGVLIASITRGMEISTKTSSNQVPILSGWNDPSFSPTASSTLSFCNGQKTGYAEYKIEAQDSDKEDKFKFSISPIAYSSWFVVSDTSISLNRKFSTIDIGTHLITIKVEDDHCPETKSSERSFKLVISPVPTVGLGKNYVINCNNPKELIPQLTNAEDITYAWSYYYWHIYMNRTPIDTVNKIDLQRGVFSTSPTFSPPIAQKTALIVTNKYGCADTAFVESLDGIIPALSIANYCYNSANPVSTQFLDASSSAEYPLDKWEWKIIEKDVTVKEFATKNGIYVFETPGIKSIFLTVTNSVGCKQSKAQGITVCEAQIAKLKTRGLLCTGNQKVEFEDTSDYSYGCIDVTHVPGNRTWYFGDNTLPRSTSSDTISHSYEKPGEYSVILESTTAGGCVAYDTVTIKVNQKPDVQIIQDAFFYPICSRGDTLLKTVTNQEGTGVLTYKWYYHSKIPEKNPTILSTGKDFLVSNIHQNQTYTLEAKDEYGCKSIDTAKIESPVKANFSYNKICNTGQTLQLVSTSKSNTPIKSYVWQASNTASDILGNDSIALFTSNIADKYYFTVTAIDTNQCLGSKTIPIDYLFINKTFDIQTDSIQICANNNVKGFSYTNATSFKNIEKIFWKIGSGDTIIQKKEGEIDLVFPNAGDYAVYHSVRYNLDTISKAFCTKDTTVMVNVKPEFKIDLLYSRICQHDTGTFDIERISGDINIPITSVQWYISNKSNEDILINDTINQKSFSYPFDYGGVYNFKITAYDSLGCVTTETRSQLASSSLTPPKLSYTSGTICTNQLAEFEASVPLDQNVENITNYYFMANSDTIIKGLGNPRSFETNYNFGHSHKNQVTLYLVDEGANIASNDSIRDLKRYCRASKTIVLNLMDLPNLDVKADTLCPKEVVTITNLSKTTEFSGPIASYQVLENHTFVSYPSNQAQWQDSYPQGGYQEFVLVAQTDSGCTDTLRKAIYVKPSPKADFILSNRFAEAFTPLTILDNSTSGVGIVPDTSHLIYSYYNMGDGTEYNAFNMYHTYNNVQSYLATHIVQNSYGCLDTITKKLDMLPYLDVPNAFTPNKDGTNDYLGLIYKSICSLQEYKIYNRWGQIIFDAEGNLDAVWDGKFKGIDQEVGVYVVYVKGLGLYNKAYELKKNLTLIR